MSSRVHSIDGSAAPTRSDFTLPGDSRESLNIEKRVARAALPQINEDGDDWDLVSERNPQRIPNPRYTQKLPERVVQPTPASTLKAAPAPIEEAHPSLLRRVWTAFSSVIHYLGSLICRLLGYGFKGESRAQGEKGALSLDLYPESLATATDFQPEQRPPSLATPIPVELDRRTDTKTPIREQSDPVWV